MAAPSTPERQLSRGPRIDYHRRFSSSSTVSSAPDIFDGDISIFDSWSPISPYTPPESSEKAGESRHSQGGFNDRLFSSQEIIPRPLLVHYPQLPPLFETRPSARYRMPCSFDDLEDSDSEIGTREESSKRCSVDRSDSNASSSLNFELRRHSQPFGDQDMDAGSRTITSLWATENSCAAPGTQSHYLSEVLQDATALTQDVNYVGTNVKHPKKLSKRPESRIRFEPYAAKPDSNLREQNSRIYEYLLQLAKGAKGKLEPSDLGYVYIFVVPRVAPGYVKVGYTGFSPENRVANIARLCKIEAKILSDKHEDAFRHYKAVEKLVHHSMHKERRKSPCKCGRVHLHGEWFETDKEHALAQLDIWRSWILRERPFDDDSGQLTKFWEWKLLGAKEQLSKIDWEDWTRPSWRDLVDFQLQNWKHQRIAIKNHLRRKDVRFYVIGTGLTYVQHRCWFGNILFTIFFVVSLLIL